MKNLFTYENKLLFVLFLTFGLIFMDKMSFTFLLPFIQKDLGFNNTQSGLVLGILSAFLRSYSLFIPTLSAQKRKY